MTSFAWKPSSRFGGVALAACSALLSVAAPGCLDRPVTPVVSHAGGVVTSKLRATRIDKVDLLLMVDNSASMEDKQSELGGRIPELITKLTDQTPDPVTGQKQSVADLHVGVITSSLGSFGTSACDPAVSAHNDDHGHLLPRSGEGPFGKATAAAPLAWVFDPKRAPSDPYQGASGATDIANDTTSVVTSAKADGCGYEASLEAVYHFLIDPAPYASAKVACTPTSGGDSCIDPATKKPNQIIRSGLDSDLVKERANFLRSDSLVAVIFLTDEDDASLKPVSLNWIPWAYAPGTMARGWGACANVPDDQEPDDNGILKSKYGCTSCFLDGTDANCKVPWPTTKLNNEVDGVNNREVRQVQKYGFNFLWSRDRYVQGFTQSTVLGSDNKTAPNPLYASGFRTPDLVLFAAITGVPEDLVANADHTAKTLSASDWSKITDPDHTKRDPRMIESTAPRTGVPKYKGGGDLSASPYNGTTPFFNGNGGDRDVPDGDDLQYACIQKRSSTPTNNDCNDATTAAGNPLCTSGGTGGGFTQTYYKAYPGLRQLRVVQSLGASGFVASICAESYAPALDGILAKIKAALNGQCISSVLSPNSDGQVPCVITESFANSTGPGGEKTCEAINGGSTGYCTPGKAPCRVDNSSFPPIDPADAAASLVLTITITNADGTTGTDSVTPTFDGTNVIAVSAKDKSATKHLVCEMIQLTGANGGSCRSNPAFSMSTGGGWCYSTDQKVIGDKCVKQGALGTIKFEGTTTPHNGSEVFTTCIAGGS